MIDLASARVNVGHRFTLGYRVVQAKALRTGHWVGKLFIPKGKLNDLRHKIKVMVKGIPTECSLAEVISDLNPSVTEERCVTRMRALRNRTDGPQTERTSNAKACAASGMRSNISDISEAHS